MCKFCEVLTNCYSQPSLPRINKSAVVYINGKCTLEFTVNWFGIDITKFNQQATCVADKSLKTNLKKKSSKFYTQVLDDLEELSQSHLKPEFSAFRKWLVDHARFREAIEVKLKEIRTECNQDFYQQVNQWLESIERFPCYFEDFFYMLTESEQKRKKRKNGSW